MGLCGGFELQSGEDSMVYLSTKADRPDRRPLETDWTQPEVVDGSGSFNQPPDVSKSVAGWA